jgi:ABC-type multidrug transport system ATPase subunit/pSer/pThr/pTyr-binding forkhead associated (FHA) protein
LRIPHTGQGSLDIVRHMQDNPAPVGGRAEGDTIRVGTTEFRWQRGAMITVGRSSACDVVLDDSLVSRTHLRVEAVDNGTWKIRDAGSRNGMFVAGRKIDAQPVLSSTQVRLGAADGPSLTIEVLRRPAAGGPSAAPPAAKPPAAPPAAKPPAVPPAAKPPAVPPAAKPPAAPPAAQPPAAQPAAAPPAAKPPAAQPVAAAPAAKPPVAPPAAIVPPGGLSRSADRNLGRHISEFVPNQDVIRIGRDAANELVIADDPLASRRHAELRRRADGRWEVNDLGSSNGTFVNGQRVGRAVLSDEDLLTIGTRTFVFSGGRLEEFSAADDTSLDATGLGVTTSGGTTLLQGVSFSLPSRSVLAIVGPSGAGKTTLLGALTGTLAPSHGQVSFAGRDLHGSYDEFRSRIGSVPQDDLVHPQLTPRSELELAAALRLPPDTGRDGRRARVQQVLGELGLQQRADLQIAKLSGGQRKRVSVGTELLTQPTLLFLDEPTSGLDPGNEQQVMTVLRQLADGGRIVVVVTHATQSLGLVDRVLFLARGGRVAYFGPPAEALTYFARHGVPGGYADIFRALDDPGDVDWPALFLADPDYNRFVGLAVKQAAERRGVAGKRPTRAISPVPVLSQFQVLVRRQVQIIASDRRTLILLALQAPVFGLLIAFLFPTRTISTNHGPFAALMLWLLVVSATWLGASGTIREIVKELPIYRRERAVGLSILAYVGSKTFVFGCITVVQSFVLVLIGLSRQSLPPLDPKHFVKNLHQVPGLFKGLRPFGIGSVLSSQRAEIAIAVALAGLAGTALGLAISALVRKSDQAVFLLPVLLVVEMSLSLPILKLDNTSPLIQQASKLVSADWGFSAVASTVSMNQLMTPYLWDLTFGQAEIGHDLNPSQPAVPPGPAVIKGLATDASWRHASAAWFSSMSIMILMTAVLLAVTVVVLRRQDIGRRAAGRRPAPAGG